MATKKTDSKKTDSKNSENDTTFETISAEKMAYGKNNFLEVSVKKATNNNGETKFVSIARGYFRDDGTERYSGKAITISTKLKEAPEMRDFIIEKLSAIDFKSI